MRRNELGILAVGLVGLALFAAAMLGGLRPLAAPGSAIAGAAGAWSMLRCQRTGVFRTRHGLLLRRDHPDGFRFHLCMGWTVILLWTLCGMLYALA